MRLKVDNARRRVIAYDPKVVGSLYDKQEARIYSNINVLMPEFLGNREDIFNPSQLLRFRSED